MTKVLAAIDGSAATRPVLATAAAVARLFGADVEAVHVHGDDDEAARAAAGAANVPLRELDGPHVQALVAAAHAEDVAAVALGARGSLVGRRPAGHTALELIVSVRKPLVVVPPHAAVPRTLGRILVPLDGTRETAAALAGTVELAAAADVEVVALHVHERETLPFFSEQPQYEVEAWTREFLARHLPQAKRVRLELRVGAPGHHVLRVAQEYAADLVALGWAQDLSAGRAEVVREVLERSDVPVLLLAVDRAGAEAPTP